MKSRVIIGLLLLSCFRTFAFDHVVSYKLYKTVTAEELTEKMKKRHVPSSLAKCKYTVDVYDVTYLTHWFDGSVIKATGLYYVPRDMNQPMAEVVYHHGTRIGKGRDEKLGGEEYLCVSLATDGYLVMEPDYIGLGGGDKFHLYQLASSEGQGSVDMIFAGQELKKELKLKDNGMLFLTGYSEGGYATMATHKLIQDKYASQIHVTASSPMSGAYDMVGVQSDVMFKPYERPHYLPYLLRGYNEVYHFAADVNTLYKSPYDTLVPKLFDGLHSIRQIDKALPSVPGDMITDAFMADYKSNPNSPLKLALRDNSLCNWKPEVPVQLCYCDHDEQVTPRNAFVAYKEMKANGAKHITLRDGGRKYGHSKCAIFAMFYTKMYFDTFRNGSKYGGKGPAGKRFMAAVAHLAIKK